VKKNRLSTWINQRYSGPLLLFLLSGLGMAVFLLSGWINAHIGFPLDDSWIHQTYARNLAELGEFSFIPGEPSAGSTSPLWTAILAIGYVLQWPFLVWTFLLGWISLGLLTWAGMLFVRRLADARFAGSLWVGVFLATEWRLLWAASSGMETMLFSLAVVCLFMLLFAKRVHWFGAGLLIGASIWLRPDGLTLLGPLAWVVFFSIPDWKNRLKALAFACGGFALLAAPYLAFNQVLAGSIWPNTFSAKQTEYAILQETAFLIRLWEQFKLPLVGAGALLLPGFLMAIIGLIKQRKWMHLAPFLWVMGFMGLYAWRLPVTYQHGRYIMPVMPVFFSLGLLGLSQVLMGFPKRFRWVASRAWVLALLFTQLIFLLLGARAYARDVAWIQTEMVQASRWVADHTQPNEIIAAHDIGALGYYSGRKILDLAGLITPDVIPIMRNEALLSEYLDKNQVDYLMTFPSWYPELTQGLEALYRTGEASEYGHEPMTIYRWSSH
jgi:arabinofuranosyltransferase